MKILVVDDDPVSSLALKKILGNLEHDVFVATDGIEALSLLKKESFRIIITDWIMPNMDGIELCRQVRAQNFVPYVYMIILTSKGEREDKLEGLKSGADDLLTKPVDTAELYARLEVGKRILEMEEHIRKNAEELSIAKMRLESNNQLLEQASRRFQDLFEGVPVACFTTDQDGRVFEWNQACKTLYGREGYEVLGQIIWEMISLPEDQKKYIEMHEKVFSGVPVESHERVDIRSDGEKRNVLSQMIPISGQNKKVVGAIVASMDITERKEMEDQLEREIIRAFDYSVQVELNQHELEHQKKELEEKNFLLSNIAVTDGLTGLVNHRSFYDHLEKEVKRFFRYQSELSLIILDIDDFKQWNDQFGHLEGDKILENVARILRDASRENDIVARYGGEEFALILQETNHEGALILAERIRSAIEEEPWRYGVVSISLGVATMDNLMKTTSDFVNAADQALYYSKKHGKNCVTSSRKIQKIAA